MSANRMLCSTCNQTFDLVPSDRPNFMVMPRHDASCGLLCVGGGFTKGDQDLERHGAPMPPAMAATMGKEALFTHHCPRCGVLRSLPAGGPRN
ncbi:MAG: hypothetical protein ACHREM_24960 [Polyangiales bacterium]